MPLATSITLGSKRETTYNYGIVVARNEHMKPEKTRSAKNLRVASLTESQTFLVLNV